MQDSSSGGAKIGLGGGAGGMEYPQTVGGSGSPPPDDLKKILLRNVFLCCQGAIKTCSKLRL